MATRTPTRAEPGNGSPAGQLAREVSSLQAALLAKLHEELPGGDAAAFASTAQELAEAFGSVTATAVGALFDGAEADRESHTSLHRPGYMRRRLDQLVETSRRYGHPFGLVVFDAEGPGTRNGDAGGGQETVLAIVGAALRDSVRLVDETFQMEEDALCVLAPGQSTVGGVQMAERLLGQLDELEAAGGMRIGISAGVAACPEHGGEAGILLHSADEAMWRARSVGQPVGVGALEESLSK